MALGHFHAGVVSRGQGRSAVDAIAYTIRANMRDDRTGEHYSYARNAADAVATFVWLPKGAPEQYRDAEALANYMESRETRKNSRTARTFEGALPHELDDRQREQLVKNFAQELTRKGLAVVAGIHRPHSHGDDRNHHFHLTVSTRVMDANGFGEKLRELDKVETLESWRERFEVLTNRKLEQHGHAARIDMRSYERQGREDTPGVHLGPVAAALERSGIETDRGDNMRAAELERGRTWTAGRPQMAIAAPIEVETAADRQKREDREARDLAVKQAEADERRARPVDQAQRGLVGAIWRLARSSWATVGNVLLGANRAELAHGRQVEDHREREASPQEKAAAAERERFAAMLRGETVVPTFKPQTPHHHEHKQDAKEPRMMVDRGKRAAPFRALVGELRDNAREDLAGAGGAEKTVADPAQEKQRPSAGMVWSHEQPAATAPPAGWGKETLSERLDRERREKGLSELRDIAPRPSRELDDERELGHDLGL